MSALYSTRAVLLVRNAFILPSRLSYKTVPEVLPKGSISFQVDLNGHLAALFVCDKLDSGHALFYRRIAVALSSRFQVSNIEYGYVRRTRPTTS
jgi:hypothetical protein